jgi:hypothetical protein
VLAASNVSTTFSITSIHYSQNFVTHQDGSLTRVRRYGQYDEEHEISDEFSPLNSVWTGSRTQYVLKKGLLGLERYDGKANLSSLPNVDVKKA